MFANKQVVCVEYQDITDADEREIFQVSHGLHKEELLLFTLYSLREFNLEWLLLRQVSLLFTFNFPY
jgi:hypothetical protein